MKKMDVFEIEKSSRERALDRSSLSMGVTVARTYRVHNLFSHRLCVYALSAEAKGISSDKFLIKNLSAEACCRFSDYFKYFNTIVRQANIASRGMNFGFGYSIKCVTWYQNTRRDILAHASLAVSVFDRI